jgi:hypothetical protein
VCSPAATCRPGEWAGPAAVSRSVGCQSGVSRWSSRRLRWGSTRPWLRSRRP